MNNTSTTNPNSTPKGIPASAGRKVSTLTTLLALSLTLTLASGCKEDVVHQRSVAELNQKAQSMMQGGDYDGAVSRLEAAHDLDPAEPNTTYNLAVAYQAKGDYPKAIAIFNQLIEKPGPDNSPMSAPQIHKAMGITYEAEADQLEASAKTLGNAPKGDKAKAQQLHHDSTVALQEALMHYQKALTGVKDVQAISTQIQSIESKLKKADSGV